MIFRTLSGAVHELSRARRSAQRHGWRVRGNVLRGYDLWGPERPDGALTIWRCYDDCGPVRP